MKLDLARYFIVGSALLLDIATFSSGPNGQAHNQTAPFDADLRSIPFDLYHDYIIVLRGSAGGLNDLHFILDIGTTPAFVDRRLALKLELKEQDARAMIVNHTVASRSTVLPNLQIGNLCANNLRVLVQDLSFLEQRLQVRIDAVIGLSVLAPHSFLIDYQAKQIRFGAPPALPFSAPLQFDQHLITVETKLNGHPARMLVGTGTSLIVLYASRLDAHFSDIRVHKKKSSTSFNLAGQVVPRELVPLRHFSIGEVSLGKKTAFLVPNQQDGNKDPVGILSPVGLGMNEVSVDFQSSRLQWSRGPGRN